MRAGERQGCVLLMGEMCPEDGYPKLREAFAGGSGLGPSSEGHCAHAGQGVCTSGEQESAQMSAGQCHSVCQ